jgi:hypothetical protein
MLRGAALPVLATSKDVGQEAYPDRRIHGRVVMTAMRQGGRGGGDSYPGQQWKIPLGLMSPVSL